MSMKLDGPIPGQSLTTEPGNVPWEQPPKYAEAEQALAFHLSKFENPDILDRTIQLMDSGFVLSDFVESLMTLGVMEGYHTIDVSMLIAPVVHEYLKTMCEAAGAEVIENNDPTPEEKEKARRKETFNLALSKELSNKKPKGATPPPETTPPPGASGMIDRR